MSESIARPAVLDTTVLSNHASTTSVSWLLETLDDVQTAPAVRAELERGHEFGYTYLEDAIDVLGEGQIEVVEIAPDLIEHDYPSLRDRLDPGEAQAFAIAASASGTLVTDDGAARSVAADYQIAFTGSDGLLVRGIVRDELTIETANEWLATWIEDRDFYAPVETVVEALPADFENG